MLYRYFLSKKGFTMVEILVVVLILSVLVGVAVPVFSGSFKKQKVEDCRNQRLVIETAVKQAMAGMIDNGKKQDKIVFAGKLQSDYYCTYKADDIHNNSDDAYDGKNCFVLWYNKFNPTQDIHSATNASNQQPVTLESIRGGYRPDSIVDYKDGCDAGYYLKKKKFAAHNENGSWVEAKRFYLYLNNAEIPVCPFVEADYNEYTAPEYMYFIFEDGTVICSNPECH